MHSASASASASCKRKLQRFLYHADTPTPDYTDTFSDCSISSMSECPTMVIIMGANRGATRTILSRGDDALPGVATPIVYSLRLKRFTLAFALCKEIRPSKGEE